MWDTKQINKQIIKKATYTGKQIVNQLKTLLNEQKQKHNKYIQTKTNQIFILILGKLNE